MKDLHLFFQGYDSVNGYQKKIFDDINKEFEIKSCVYTSRDNDHSDDLDDRFTKVDYDMCANCTYEDKIDFNNCLPLDYNTLLSMEPYEIMATKMLCRITDFDIYTFDEGKRYYLQHLRFWNDVFEKNEINFAVLTGIPHHTHDYIIYGLLKIKKIPFVIFAPTHLPHWCFVGNDLYDLPRRMMARYQELLQDGSSEVTLPDSVEKYYQALLKENKATKVKTMLGAADRAAHAKREMKMIMAYVVPEYVRKRHIKWIRHGIAGLIKGKETNTLKKEIAHVKDDLYWIKRTKHKLKYCDRLSDYEALAVKPDTTKEKYVLFLLHQQPEATTLPQAGPFVEQELAIALLASALKKHGVKLYVKEHFVQPYRMHTFYKDIASMDNVVLVSSDAESVDLLEHCVAAATPAGTVAIEAPANGKPVMNLGFGGFERGPGIYHIGSVDDIDKAMEEILEMHAKGQLIDRVSVRKYFKAFSDTGLCVYSPIEGADQELVEKSRRDIVELVKEEIRCAL